MGLAEHVVQTVRQGLHKYGLLRGSHHNWHLMLPWIAMGYQFNKQTILGMLLDSIRFVCALPLPRPRPRVDVCCVLPALLCKNLVAGVTMSTSRVSGSRPPP